MGYTMGGREALSFEILYSENIRSLVLERASPGLKTEKERKKRRDHDKNLAFRMKDNGIEDFVDEWEKIPLFASQKKLPVEIKHKIREERLSQSVDGLND